MQHQTVGSGRTRHIDEVVEDEASGLLSLIQGVFYWGVLALGVAIPIAGAIWGVIR